MATPRLKTFTLGCKVNQYETELVREALTQFGYESAPTDQPADLCVINTCTVTHEGDAKSRSVIRRMARQNPDAKLVVMGCYATRDPEAVRSLPNVVEVVTDKRELPDLLGRFGVVDFPDGISQFSNHHRAFIKVQDGCLLKCSYCIIPQVRPQMSSRPMSDIVREVGRLAQAGYQEVVLTGIHLGHYGVDMNRGKAKADWTRLPQLLRELMAIDSHFRIRLSSIEATEVTRELIEIAAEHPRQICPHFHICLQSGSDSVLRRMKRRWGTKRFFDRCQLIKQAIDRPALTTDVIVGFPGETEGEFEQTCDFVRSVGFSKIHLFPFSARRGTPAFDMPGQLSKGEKSVRMQQLSQIESELRLRYFRELVDCQLDVLHETRDPATGASRGTSCRFAPACVTKSAAKLGEIERVVVTDVKADELVVSPVFREPAKPRVQGV